MTFGFLDSRGSFMFLDLIFVRIGICGRRSLASSLLLRGDERAVAFHVNSPKFSVDEIDSRD